MEDRKSISKFSAETEKLSPVNEQALRRLARDGPELFFADSSASAFRSDVNLTIRFASDEVKANEDVAKSAILASSDAWRDVDTKTLSQHKDLVLLALRHGNDVLENPLVQSLYDDRDIMQKAIQQGSVDILSTYNSGLVDDKSFMIMAADVDAVAAFEAASPGLKDDPEFLHASSTSCGRYSSRLVTVAVHDSQESMLRLTDSSASSGSSHPYEATLYFGASTFQSNPSHVGGYGFIIYSAYNHKEITSGSEYLTGEDFPWAADQCTNNQAEYMGLLRGLYAASHEGICRLKVRGASELVIRQMEGRYAVRKQSIAELHNQCLEAVDGFQKISFEHVYRDENTRARRLARDAISEYVGYSYSDSDSDDDYY
eukprot:g845.t1